MYKICVFIPTTHVDLVKSAMFQAGGGRIGNYDSCSFEYEGLGQFRPLQGSRAFLGKENELEKVRETKVEMAVENLFVSQVISAMRKSHPYEVPAYDVIKLEDF